MVEHVSIGTVHDVYRDLEVLRRDLGEDVGRLETLVAMSREHNATRVADYLEGEVRALKGRLLHIERVQQRLSNLGFAPDKPGP